MMMYENQGYGVAAGQLNTAGLMRADSYATPTAPQEPRMIRLIDSVSRLCKQQGDQYVRLMSLSDRLMGPQPQGVEANQKERLQHAGPPLFSHLDDILEQMHRQGTMLEQEVQRLETLC